MTPIESSSEATGPESGPISEIDVLWMTAGLGSDGDTIAVTAATQPSIEDLVLGAFPWISKVNFHNPFLACPKCDLPRLFLRFSDFAAPNAEQQLPRYFAERNWKWWRWRFVSVAAVRGTK